MGEHGNINKTCNEPLGEIVASFPNNPQDGTNDPDQGGGVSSSFQCKVPRKDPTSAKEGSGKDDPKQLGLDFHCQTNNQDETVCNKSQDSSVLCLSCVTKTKLVF